MVELTKEQFVEIINHIEEQLDKDDKLSDLMVCEDTTGWIVTAPHLITDVITLLTMMLDDQDEWISWWLWEVADGVIREDKMYGEDDAITDNGN